MEIKEALFLTSELQGMRAGSFRQQRWVETFLSLGVRTCIIDAPSASRCVVREFDALEKFQIFRRSVATDGGGRMTGIREGRFAAVMRRLKHRFVVDLFYPSVLLQCMAVYRRISKASGTFLVMASSPPFSTAVVGAAMKMLFRNRIVFVVDMRDAWALHPALGVQTAFRRWIESAVFREADYRSTVSVGLSREFERAYGVPVRVCYNVATHYQSERTVSDLRIGEIIPHIDDSKVVISYTGSTPAGFYDIETFVRAVQRLRDSHDTRALNVQFLFVGACDEVRVVVDRLVGRDDVFVFQDHLRSDLSGAIQMGSDALLFFAFDGDDNRGVVSTKFFEYLAVGKPILPLGIRLGSDVDVLLRSCCGESVSAVSTDEIFSLLSRMSTEGVDILPRLAHPERLEQLRTTYTDSAIEWLGR
jgi:glycosyltransferase involved in cell wall biosynthesis